MRMILFVALGLLAPTAKAQVGEWWFWPKYSLGQKADNYPGHRIDAPMSQLDLVGTESTPLVFHTEDPTERIINFMDKTKLPKGNFSVEMWLVNHVNQQVGVLATLKSKSAHEEPSWLLGLYGRDIVYTLKTDDSNFTTLMQHQVKGRGWKSYWGHLVATYDGRYMKLWLNGELLSETSVGKRKPFDDSYQLEIASYMKNEPYMDLGNMLKSLRIYDRAIDKEEINSKFDVLKDMVTQGKLFPGIFHFTAGPYLNNATTSSIHVVWETDRAADFVIEYGKSCRSIRRSRFLHKRSNARTIVPSH
jgi:hypothetical protein